MISHAPFAVTGRRTLHLANGRFSSINAKTAACLLRYRAADAVAVLDAAQAGKTAAAVLGYGGAVPVVATLGEALALGPEVAIVGTAPRGGGIEGSMGDDIEACLRAGVDVVSGLHEFLGDDDRFAGACAASGAQVWDVRRPPATRSVSEGAGCTSGARVVLTVGTDCNVGKMTVVFELYRAARARGARVEWAATGQTGMILRGRGVPIDAVVADFIGGATEELVEVEGRDADLVFVEGQGAIIHPGYAGVTLGLMYGAMPDCMVLVHDATRDTLKGLSLRMPPLDELVARYQHAMAALRPSPVVAVAVNTSRLDDAAARALLSRIETQTGLPATDAVRYGCDPILDAVEAHLAGP